MEYGDLKDVSVKLAVFCSITAFDIQNVSKLA